MTDKDDMMTRVQWKLYKNEPFYGYIGCKLAWEESTQVPTAATDGYKILWNRKFFEGLNENERIGVMIHEIHHVIKKHTIRIRGRDPEVWNIATDMQINEEIASGFTNDKYSLPKDLVFDKDKEYQGWVEEDIYDDMAKKIKENKKNLGSFGRMIGEVLPHGSTFGDGDDNGGSGDSNSQSYDDIDAERQIDKMIKEAANIAKKVGKLPAGLRDYAEAAGQHKVNWKAELSRIVEPLFPTDLSWSPPNRRTIWNNVYFPSHKKDGVGEIVMGLDTSGSISQKEISQYLAEVRFIFDNVKPSKVHMIWFESHVWHYEESQEFSMPNKIQTGGTSFQSVWDEIEKRSLNPRILIMLTDMYDSFPKEPQYPVIWCATSDIVAPYGKTIRVHL